MTVVLQLFRADRGFHHVILQDEERKDLIFLPCYHLAAQRAGPPSLVHPSQGEGLLTRSVFSPFSHPIPILPHLQPDSHLQSELSPQFNVCTC